MNPGPKSLLRKIPLLGSLVPEATLDERLSGGCRIWERAAGWDPESLSWETRLVAAFGKPSYWRGGIFVGRGSSNRPFTPILYSTVSEDALKMEILGEIARRFPEESFREGILEEVSPERDLRRSLLERLFSGKVAFGKASGFSAILYFDPDEPAASAGSGWRFAWDREMKYAMIGLLSRVMEHRGIYSEEELDLWLSARGV